MLEVPGPNNTVMKLARELFVGSLFILTVPFIVMDIGISAFSPQEEEAGAAASFLYDYLALRAMILLAAYNVVCYTLLFSSSFRVVTPPLMWSGIVTMAWNVIGLVCFGWHSRYIFISSVGLFFLYSWCLPKFRK
jgi:hypothetical protein